MTSHDRACPLDNLPDLDCAICLAIGKARTEERQIRADIWKANIGPISRRNYEEGYRDAAEGRPMRQS
jgi:hypothetical protein